MSAQSGRSQAAGTKTGYRLRRLLCKPWLLALLLVGLGYLMLQGEILTSIVNHINAYVKHTGDVKSTGGGLSLEYPSVAQSIIEVQDLGFAEIFPYFHPWMEAAALGLLGFGLVAVRRPLVKSMIGTGNFAGIVNGNNEFGGYIQKSRRLPQTHKPMAAVRLNQRGGFNQRGKMLHQMQHAVLALPLGQGGEGRHIKHGAQAVLRIKHRCGGAAGRCTRCGGGSIWR